MTITEYAELEHRVKKLEAKINRCVSELNQIKSSLVEFTGELSQTNEEQPCYFFDDHTPYFDVLGENIPKNRQKI